jgi:HAD superfamily hydrolase (TIGR01549 family)
MSFRAVLFDLDGTLLNSIDGIVECFEHVLAEFQPGHSFTRQDMIMKIGEPVPKQMLEFSGGLTQQVDPMVKRYRELMGKRLASFPLYAGVVETLRFLREKNFLTGLVTSKSRGPTDISLVQHKLHSLFDVIVTADDTLVHKPCPEPLLYAAEKIQVDPVDILFIGDSVHDINCAHAAGSSAGAAYWGPFPRDLLDSLNPKFGFNSLPEISLRVGEFLLPK